MPGSQILSFGSYRLDTQQEQFWRETQLVRLTPKAFQVLSYVVERPGQLVTKEELFRVLWADTVVGDAALTMCIQEIRKALQDNAKSPQYLETVHRRGFRFLAAVEEYSPALPGALRQAAMWMSSHKHTSPPLFLLTPFLPNLRETRGDTWHGITAVTLTWDTSHSGPLTSIIQVSGRTGWVL